MSGKKERKKERKKKKMRKVAVILLACMLFLPSGAEETWNGTRAFRKEKNWCGPLHEKDPPAMHGLDDRDCIKAFPSNFSRDFMCGVVHGGMPSVPGFAHPPSNIFDVAAIPDEPGG